MTEFSTTRRILPRLSFNKDRQFTSPACAETACEPSSVSKTVILYSDIMFSEKTDGGLVVFDLQQQVAYHRVMTMYLFLCGL